MISHGPCRRMARCFGVVDLRVYFCFTFLTILTSGCVKIPGGWKIGFARALPGMYFSQGCHVTSHTITVQGTPSDFALLRSVYNTRSLALSNRPTVDPLVNQRVQHYGKTKSFQSNQGVPCTHLLTRSHELGLRMCFGRMSLFNPTHPTSRTLRYTARWIVSLRTPKPWF